ncbi:MAG: hypothetical protein AAB229_10420 [Candidatus Hydrogenedentota bacterium]
MIFLFGLLLAVAWAKLEIEIEGEQGWAAGLPTWRIEKHWMLDVFYGGRPLTGYHFWAFTFVLLVFHLPFFLDWPWTIRNELRLLGGYSVFWVVEDFLWFVFNPRFGWRRFHPASVPWHKRWWFGLPSDYWVFGAFALGTLLIP